jgi:glucuronokinase
MENGASLTTELRMHGHGKYKYGQLINALRLRRKLVHIEAGNIEMVELARQTGASAKFTGSGGAIIGTYTNEEMFQHLTITLNKKEIEVIKPDIVSNPNS